MTQANVWFDQKNIAKINSFLCNWKKHFIYFFDLNSPQKMKKMPPPCLHLPGQRLWQVNFEFFREFSMH